MKDVEYIRSICGYIVYCESQKIIDLENKFGSIKKHSSNIIGLIEKGDYINGYLVIDTDIKNNMICLLMPFNEDNLSNSNIVWKGLEKGDRIVTKEQFKSIGYVI